MRNIRKIIIVFFASFLVCTLFAQQEAMKEAEEAYQKEDYGKAIELYERLLKTYGESSEVYYNLGNAYYKLEKTAPAILNYERALLLDPGDSDIRFNLQMARQRAVDKIEPIGHFFLTEWLQVVRNKASADSWAKIGIICFILFLGCLILFFFSKWIYIKKIGFYSALSLLFLSLVANVFAWNQKKELLNRKKAIVFTPTITVKSSPDASGTDLFILHEGTKVTIKSSLGEWHEIEIEDGNIGWIPVKELEII